MVTTIYLCAPKVCESDQKFVVLQVIPIIEAVPEFAQVLKIFPVDGNIFPVSACIRIPLIVSVSALLALLSVLKVTVMVAAVTAMVAAVISLPPLYVTTPEPALNLRLVGAVSINVVLV